MAKIGDKENQARALREAQYSSRGNREIGPILQPTERPPSVVRTKPPKAGSLGKPEIVTGPRKTSTHQYRDPEKRKAYMAKYMRDYRKRQAEKRAK